MQDRPTLQEVPGTPRLVLQSFDSPAALVPDVDEQSIGSFSAENDNLVRMTNNNNHAPVSPWTPRSTMSRRLDRRQLMTQFRSPSHPAPRTPKLAPVSPLIAASPSEQLVPGTPIGADSRHQAISTSGKSDDVNRFTLTPNARSASGTPTSHAGSVGRRAILRKKLLHVCPSKTHPGVYSGATSPALPMSARRDISSIRTPTQPKVLPSTLVSGEAPRRTTAAQEQPSTASVSQEDSCSDFLDHIV